MNEQETEEETGEETTTGTEDVGSKSETTPLIDIANQAAKRMEDANKETGRLQDIQAERDQRIALGGESEGGIETTPEFTEEELASRKRIKAVADASGSDWGKKYE